jgi:hypothetical protein
MITSDPSKRKMVSVSVGAILVCPFLYKVGGFTDAFVGIDPLTICAKAYYEEVSNEVIP